MYIELVRRVMEDASALHVAETQRPTAEMLREIAEHIDATSREHRRDEPEIRYDDPLCRLGYLYTHAAANATLFEKVLGRSDELRGKIDGASEGVLNVCSLGGGPGTELLGLAKYLLRFPDIAPPRKISFTVIDNVLEWADTWSRLADAVEDEFRSSLAQDGIEPPAIAPMFLPLNVLEASSYRSFGYQFKSADIVVFNYLFSENKTRLAGARQALEQLAKFTSDECAFVVIDRLEHDPRFTEDVVGLFQSAFGVEVTCRQLGGTLDGDEQTSEMGEMLISTLNRRPRVKFFTDIYRDPTVFWFVVKRR